MTRHPWDEAPPDGPCYCVECGEPVEDDRRVYGWPTCHACLAPPEPLPIRLIKSRGAEADDTGDRR